MFELYLENENANIVNINDNINYVVISAEGLTPPSASIFTAKSPNRKGVKYNGSTLNERIVVINIKLLGDIEANRNALYAWVDTEQYCKIRYKNGMKNVYCEGHVQDCPIELFTDNEVVSLAVLCEDPYWKDMQEIKTEISAMIKQFTFPFAIDEIGVPFSTIRDTNTTNVYYTGAETGVEIKIKCTGDVENLTIYNARNVAEKFEVATTLPAGWVVVIDTEHSPKTIKAYKEDGTTENLLKYVKNPTWFTLKKGNNAFSYTTANGNENAEITIGFTTKYAGV
jgi:hypothetical protein